MSLLLAIGSTVFAVDPFNHYRADADMTKIIYQIPYYQNIGIAKHAQYDTLITGSSMTQNFLANKFDEELGCKAIRLSFDGGVADDFILLLKTATENNPQLKRVYFGLDNYLITDDSALNQIEDRIPYYLSDNNIFNDVRYLYNKDVIFKYIRVHFAYKYSDSYNFYQMHVWDDGSIITSAEKVLEGYSPPAVEEVLSEDYFYESADYLTQKLLEIVKENSDIEFVFFAPPYSVLYWHSQKVSGKLSATLSAVARCYNQLLDCENVRMFYFQNEFDMIVDLDNYKDYTHYMMGYNDYMRTCFANGKNEITRDDYQKNLDAMRDFVNNYDYDKLYMKSE